MGTSPTWAGNRSSLGKWVTLLCLCSALLGCNTASWLINNPAPEFRKSKIAIEDKAKRTHSVSAQTLVSASRDSALHLACEHMLAIDSRGRGTDYLVPDDCTNDTSTTSVPPETSAAKAL